tara:strand:+ start:269 stop:544 length:276 start_codon:yes stop_codon:yes gene_type:complete
MVTNDREGEGDNPDESSEVMSQLASEIQAAVDVTSEEIEGLSNEITQTEEEVEGEDESDFELWPSPLKQSTYMFIWGLASLASFAVFFKYF